MRRIVLVVLASGLLTASAAFAAGLADPVDQVDKEWQGHLHVKRGTLFGKPQRVGTLVLETKGLFGAEEGTAPSKVQFFKGIRKLMPKKFKFVAGYRRKAPSTEDVYTFRSNALRTVPGIKEAPPYSAKGDRKPLGTFTLIVRHEEGDGNRVETATLHLGLPEDFFDDKSILCNPFLL